MSAKQTIIGLATYNSWRRGDETIEMPAPAEIGATIDHAVNLLRKYDEMERKLAAEREKVRVLRAALTEIMENSSGWAESTAREALESTEGDT